MNLQLPGPLPGSFFYKKMVKRALEAIPELLSFIHACYGVFDEEPIYPL